jgi:hypothetical protein
MGNKDSEYIKLQDDNHRHGKQLPAVENHVGEELQCEAEVTQEHIRQLRDIVVRQSAALICAMNALDDVLPNGDVRVGKMAQCLDFDLPWIK